MSINFCVPARFELDYAEALGRMNREVTGPQRVVEVYGAVPGQVVGSLRSGLPYTSMKQLRAFVATLGAHRIEFNYLFNTSLMDGQEETREGRRAMHTLIGSLLDGGIRRFTMALPYLVRFVRKHYPQTEIVASIVAGIRSTHMAQRFLDLGVNRIVVVQDLNRRLDILESIIAMGTPVEILVNSPCLHACAASSHHANLTSMAATSTGPFAHASPQSCAKIATCLLECRLGRFSDPAEVIRIPWIRPEDIVDYHGLGIAYFKIDGRINSASYNLERISAYLRGRHEGNLLYLLLPNVPRYRRELFEAPADFYRLYVDNTCLDGFVKRMPCLRRDISCRTCSFCSRFASEHVMVDVDWAMLRSAELNAEIDERYALD